MRRMRASALGFVGCLLAGPASVRAQCGPGWLPGNGVPGLNAVGYSSTIWDPDGDGPARSLLVAGGVFTVAGETVCFHVGAWDGEKWSSLGGGLNDQPFALASYRGELIAGGAFSKAEGTPASRIARWDGQFWKPLDEGLNGSVMTMAVYHDRLIVSGNFTTAGEILARNVAQWDGDAWSAMGYISGSCNAFAVFDDKLIMGGSFSYVYGVGRCRVAVWDGGPTWHALGADPPFIVRSFGVLDGELLAAGDWYVGGQHTMTVARWRNSQWEILGEGVPGGAAPNLVVWRGGLYLGGSSSINGTTGGVVTWDGSAWKALPALNGGYGVNAWSVYEDRLVAVGAFTTAGSEPSRYIASWDGAQWHGVMPAFDGPVRALAAYRGELIAAGGFGRAPGIGAEGIAAWDGGAWHGVGAGLTGVAGDGTGVGATSVGVWNDGLLAAGYFGVAGGAPANVVARWDGASWQALGTGFSGGSEFGCVKALGAVGTDLYVGGDFEGAGATALHGVARWTGSSWESVGNGAGGVSSDSGTPGVNAIASFRGAMVAGGHFTRAGSTPVASVATWDGAAWGALGDGVSGDVYAMVEYHDELIVGGSFTSAGDVPAKNLAAWNGAQWRAIGDAAGPVTALTVQGDSLVAGGTITSIGGTAASNLARWDGTSWQAIGGGVNGPVYALGPYGDELASGGAFLTAGGQSSNYFARWTPAPTAPVVVQQPAPVSTCPGMEATFRVSAKGTAPFSYGWRKNGANLYEGPGSGGSRVAGVATPVLSVSGVSPGDAGAYDCVITNACGSVTSGAGTLLVCVADLDCNSFVNGDDLDSFADLFWAGDPGADVDRNGFVNAEDLDLFVGAFEAGC